MNPGFSRLRVQGFRRLYDLDMKLASVNVLIGTNGVGKTSILEVMRLLAAATTQGHLRNFLSAAGGLPSVMTLGRKESMTLSVTMPLEDGKSQGYVLALQSSGQGYEITEEKVVDERGQTIWQNQAAGLMPNPFKSSLETALAQNLVSHKNAESLRERLTSISSYHPIDVSPRAPVRLPQTVQIATTPGANGEDMVSCLYNLRETDHDRFASIEDTIRVVFSNFERLELPPAAAGLLSLAWRERPYRHPLYAHQLSEGTLRFLWLVTLLQSPGLPSVTLIDEPEVSLHPEMLRLLVELFREASMRTQLIVATHSDRLVSFLEPSELVVCDLDEEGGMKATRADDLDIEHWLRDYSLDQLWQMGQLGGRA